MRKIAFAAGLTLMATSAVAGAGGPDARPRLPPGANVSAPLAPFFIDLAGLDARTDPPTRDPANPRYPAATALPDGQLPPPRATGNFILGPSHPAAPETIVHEGVPKGRILTFTLSSANGTI